ncbi:1-acyl-sn-glycerol-3-phosphate acyltransferase [Propionibacterium freudenreichii]|uniref:lysophospholipid acyltransferase family protein n=1 Tax=Propionibacterium freudenreichii TaxID=1744 RepID=UPI0005A5C5BE|nr:lysophospholipid acyltransferase family protein [Propionibacterium freudenreichii]MDK9320107.1 1-acyl-sn-glycerol-3-phosphate acyltransferase [Propionibacterium freudenreichii]CEI23203.1 Acyltransferase PlsC [Propionibacterium freudenreichii]
MWYTLFKYLLFRPGVKLLLHPTLQGEQNIPRQGGAVLASNHLDIADTLALPALMRRRLTFPAKKELFEGRTRWGRIVAWFLTAVGMVPLDRSGGRASASGLGPIDQVLTDGGLAGIFPEGTRSPDGSLYKGHTGVARMALDMQVPVIPVAMVNTTVRRNRLGLPTMHDGRMIIGRPLDYSPWRHQRDDVRVLRWITNDVLAHVQQLSGQPYVDVYGFRVKYGNLRDADLTRFRKDSPTAGLPVPPTDAELGLAGHDEAGSPAPSPRGTESGPGDDKDVRDE